MEVLLKGVAGMTTAQKTKRKLIVSSTNEGTIKAVDAAIKIFTTIKGERVDIQSLMPSVLADSFSLVFPLNAIEEVYIRANVTHIAEGIAGDFGDSTLTIEETEIEVV